jgi:hypothetical protein
MARVACWKSILAVLIQVWATKATASAVEIRPWVTVSTPARPEVHLLIRNKTALPIDFKLELGGVEDGEKLECAGVSTPEPDFLTRFHFWNGVSFGDSRGHIPANGWAHRSILLGEWGVIPPCKVPFRLSLHSEGGALAPIDGTVEVPVAGPPVRGDVSEEDITWKTMVEEHRLYDGRLVARIAVENRQNHGVVVRLDRRILSCKQTGSASWAMHHGVVQGEDVGPMQVGAGGLGVFVAAIDTWDLSDYSRCRVSADIVLDSRSGLKRIHRIEFPLTPTGFLDAGTKDRR